MPSAGRRSEDAGVKGGCQQYELVVRGRIGQKLVTALAGFEVVESTGASTRLCGWVVDQAALQSVLATAGDLGMEILSFRRVDGP